MSNTPREDRSRLRVLVSGHLPPPFGGMATYYESLLSSSLPEQVDLRFVQTSSQQRALSSSGSLSLSNALSAVQDCGRFTLAVLGHKPEVCHIGTAFGLSMLKHGVCAAIARLSGSRVLLHPHCGLSVMYGERPAWWRWVFRRIVDLADGLITLSNEWAQLNTVLPNCGIYYLPNGLDLRPFRQVAQEHMARQGSDAVFHILYLGYLGKAKGSFDLIDALGQLVREGMEVSLEMVGAELADGELDALRECLTAARLGQAVRLHGPTFGQDKIDLFRNADVFVYPSYSEGMPMAVIEAMACGLPIVATSVGGLPDLVRNGVNGVLVRPGEPAELAGALRRLAADPELRWAMQQKSHQLASEQYDVERHVAGLVNIYSRYAANVIQDDPGRAAPTVSR